jgi:spermidine synthase
VTTDRSSDAQATPASSPAFTSATAAFALLLGAVAAAGMASLLYEVLWVRQLSLSLGSTVYATSTMLFAFLGGLALGSWISGRRADSLSSPLGSLARVELGAAAVGAMAVPVLGLTGRAYVLAASGLGIGPGLAFAMRVGVSLLVMLLPATLFGLAFPLAVTAAARLERLGRASSGVYAASSFGSALGAAVGGLLLEPALGLTASALIGAGINVLAAVLVWSALRVQAEANRLE